MARIHVPDLVVDEVLDAKALNLIRGGSSERRPSLLARLASNPGSRLPGQTWKPSTPPGEKHAG
jgi:hypothetical protein